jgi:16S rRNA (uracil1498-N3)-methyltransferase
VVRVLRLGTGAALKLFNGHGGEYEATIEAVRRDAVTVRIGAHDPVERESPLRITLLQGLARGEKMDLILQKATELGVAAFMPVQMARSTVRLDAHNTAAKHRHWQSVVISACEQCGRNTVPPVSAAQPFQESLAAASAHKLMLAPDEGTRTLFEWAAAVRLSAEPGTAISLLVGPEGGFDAAEVSAASAAGFERVRLGPRILRTETAGLAALAALQTLAGDLR